MPGNDWIVGGNRRTIAAERIYAAATDLITRYGLNALDIDKLARESTAPERPSTAVPAARPRSGMSF